MYGVCPVHPYILTVFVLFLIYRYNRSQLVLKNDYSYPYKYTQTRIKSPIQFNIFSMLTVYLQTIWLYLKPNEYTYKLYIGETGAVLILTQTVFKKLSRSCVN